MSDSLSSQNAEESGEPNYETLEEYIFETQRDNENETGKSIRFRDWQEMQLNIIKNKLGTNAVEVVARSYLMGLARLRENQHEDVKNLSEILTEFLIVMGMDPRNEDNLHKIGTRMDTLEMSEPEDLKGKLKDPKRYKVRESALSEVENNYVNDAFFGGWIHRYVAALGFLDSELVTDTTADKLSSFGSAVNESMGDARDEIESMIMDYISMSQGHWIENGLRPDVYESMIEVVEMMETDRKSTCKTLMGQAEQYIEEKDVQGEE